MKTCPNCHKENEDGVNICKYCLYDLSDTDDDRVNKEKLEHDKKSFIKMITISSILVAIVALLILAFIVIQSAELPNYGTGSEISFTMEDSSNTSSNATQEFNEYLYDISTANACVDAQEYDEAIACYKEAIEVDPNQDSAYIGLANAYELSGKHKEAVSTLENAYSKLGSDSIKKRLDELNK